MSTAKKNDALTVGEITHCIKGLLENALARVRVLGEVGRVKKHQNGHVFLTLKDQDARLECVVWKTTIPWLSYRPDEGARVIATGRLNVYPPHGTYRLIIEKLEPAGEGALRAEFEATRLRLQAEGLFEPERKRSLPVLPRAVGVVTSESGAALRDIVAIINRRSPQIPVICFSARVQGPGAVSDLLHALRLAVTDPRIEVVIIGRGGGSLEDLWAFNDEQLARAIADSPIPIVSAIGHETDFTIADLVADYRAATPSEAAEAVVPEQVLLRAQLVGIRQRLDRVIKRTIEQHRLQLQHQTQQVVAALVLDRRRLKLIELHHRCRDAAQHNLRGSHTRLRRLEQRLQAAHPAAQLADSRRHLDLLEARLEAGPRQIERSRLRLSALAERLAVLSPLASLARGYSLTLKDGMLITDASMVTLGDEIDVRLARGAVRAQITAVEALQDDG